MTLLLVVGLGQFWLSIISCCSDGQLSGGVTWRREISTTDAQGENTILVIIIQSTSHFSHYETDNDTDNDIMTLTMTL